MVGGSPTWANKSSNSRSTRDRGLRIGHSVLGDWKSGIRRRAEVIK